MSRLHKGDLAQDELPDFMNVLSACKVRDPQVLFMAVGDATCDGAPLQVGQFETTAELMNQRLTWSYLEGGGGGQNKESYELALYFLAEHTDMDCWVKRKKRRYIFMDRAHRCERRWRDLLGDHVILFENSEATASAELTLQKL